MYSNWRITQRGAGPGSVVPIPDRTTLQEIIDLLKDVGAIPVHLTVFSLEADQFVDNAMHVLDSRGKILVTLEKLER